jgi:hypothetical protein
LSEHSKSPFSKEGLSTIPPFLKGKWPNLFWPLPNPNLAIETHRYVFSRTEENIEVVYRIFRLWYFENSLAA